MSWALKRSGGRPSLSVLCCVFLVCVSVPALAEEDAGIVIGVRRDAAAPSKPNAKIWFKTGLSDAEVHAEAIAAAKVLAANKLNSSEADDLKQAIGRGERPMRQRISVAFELEELSRSDAPQGYDCGVGAD